ncbi:MAG TPA: hypothetical protein VMH87_09525 [Pseudomonadales bacterium]|nr:hypothetical protein [Pseudomonadales bacterium]
MKTEFEQIREQIHEIRNFLGPLDIKLENLDHQISKSRLSFETRAAELESRITMNSSEIALHSEQIRQIQIFLKMPAIAQSAQSVPVKDNRAAAAVHEDKQNPGELPPQKPPTS